MKGYDSFAGSIKSGGTTRRAAKMVILNADHPDVLDFIRCKAEEEKKAWALIEAGFDAGVNVTGGAHRPGPIQNTNPPVGGDDQVISGGPYRRRRQNHRGRGRSGHGTLKSA